MLKGDPDGYNKNANTKWANIETNFEIKKKKPCDFMSFAR